MPQHVESNHVYINNTQFMGNYADSGGAAAVLLCTGTELHISGSRYIKMLLSLLVEEWQSNLTTAVLLSAF